MSTGTLTALLTGLLIGGVALGWVASANWQRSLALPPQLRSISYIYGTTIILLCFAVRCFVIDDPAALTDLTIIIVLCGLWTIGTHALHARANAADVQAAPPPSGQKGRDGQ